jgi:hypothetical protein
VEFAGEARGITGSEKAAGSIHSEEMHRISSSRCVRRRQLLFVVRYVVPALVCLAGVVIVATAGMDDYGPEALAALVGAGLAIYLMNKLMRMGIDGDAQRDVEEARRLFLDRYGMWPDEVPGGWRPPDGDPDATATVARIVEERRKGRLPS